MKNSITKLSSLVVIAFLTLSFSVNAAERKEVKSDASKVVWKGYKVTGSHEGTIKIKSGTLLFDDSKLVGGEFVIDMTTIAVTDLSGEYQAKLEGHLKSDDFFSVEKNPTSKIVFKKIKTTGKNSYEVTGDLTIKGITKSVKFEIAVYGSKASVNLTIDRTEFDVQYGSTSFFEDLKDKAIYDEFDIVADLIF